MGLDLEEGRKPLQLPGAAEPPGKSKASKVPERAVRGDCLLAFFRLINMITICCAALCMVADCMALVAKGRPQVTRPLEINGASATLATKMHSGIDSYSRELHAHGV